MDHETGVTLPSLHTLISLPDFKAILAIDDREDRLAAFCLVTATFTIEQHCRRSLVLKRHVERIEVYADLLLSLREYPVREVLAVYAKKAGGFFGREGGGGSGEGELVEPDFYRVLPDLEGREECDPCGTLEDTVYSLVLSPAYRRSGPLGGIKVVYRAGYAPGDVPADLASACLELAAWNMSRYRGRRIGMTGNVRGSGKDGEHLEASMPENVRMLLEPYKRRMI
jgi:hypothetical protein